MENTNECRPAIERFTQFMLSESSKYDAIYGGCHTFLVILSTLADLSYR
ncbi:MAG: hypothetical protein ACPHV3_02750 [Vibrio sp.]